MHFYIFVNDSFSFWALLKICICCRIQRLKCQSKIFLATVSKIIFYQKYSSLFRANMSYRIYSVLQKKIICGEYLPSNPFVSYVFQSSGTTWPTQAKRLTETIPVFHFQAETIQAEIIQHMMWLQAYSRGHVLRMSWLCGFLCHLWEKCFFHLQSY